MFQRRIVFTTLFVMALFAFLVAPAAAQERDPGQLVVGGAYTLAAGQQLNGDLGVIGGVATIEEDATVNGDIMVAGGSLTVAGRINGQRGHIPAVHKRFAAGFHLQFTNRLPGLHVQ